jgi:hypothetical protein
LSLTSFGYSELIFPAIHSGGDEVTGGHENQEHKRGPREPPKKTFFRKKRIIARPSAGRSFIPIGIRFVAIGRRWVISRCHALQNM